MGGLLDDNGKGHKPKKTVNFRILLLVFFMMAFGVLACVSLFILRINQIKNTALEAHVRNLESGKASLNKNLKEIQAHRNRLAAAAEATKAENQKQEGKLAQAHDDIATLQQELRGLKQEAEELKQQAKACTAESQRFVAQLAEAQAQVDVAQSQLKEAQQKLQQSHSQAAADQVAAASLAGAARQQAAEGSLEQQQAVAGRTGGGTDLVAGAGSGRAQGTGTTATALGSGAKIAGAHHAAASTAGRLDGTLGQEVAAANVGHSLGGGSTSQSALVAGAHVAQKQQAAHQTAEQKAAEALANQQAIFGLNGGNAGSSDSGSAQVGASDKAGAGSGGAADASARTGAGAGAGAGTAGGDHLFELKGSGHRGGTGGGSMWGTDEDNDAGTLFGDGDTGGGSDEDAAAGSQVGGMLGRGKQVQQAQQQQQGGARTKGQVLVSKSDDQGMPRLGIQ